MRFHGLVRLALIAVGRFDYAFAVAGLIALGVPVIVSGWRDTLPVTTAREPWQEFKRGIAEVSADRLVLATSGAQAAQFVLHGALSAFLPLYGRDALGLTVTQLGWLFGVQSLTTLAVRPAIGFACRIASAGAGSSSPAWSCADGGCSRLARHGDVRNHRGDRRLRHGGGDHHGRNERVHHRRDAAGALGVMASPASSETIYDVGDAILGPIGAGVRDLSALDVSR